MVTVNIGSECFVDMQQRAQQFLKGCCPSVLFHIFGIGSGVTWSGDYKSWDLAQKASTGYDSNVILNKVKDSLLKVKNGQATYERDSLLFKEIEYSWPLLAAIMWVAAQSNGELNIVDYGGSLGSTYFQNREFLRHLPKVQWNIVEQKNFVDVGQESFENDVVRFFYDVESVLEESSPDAILFSSVIQYIERPYELLEKIKELGFRFILFDRTPFTFNGTDRLTVQKVSPKIYPADYPCWFFDRRRFYSFFDDKYIAIAGFKSLDRANVPSTFEGCIFRKK